MVPSVTMEDFDKEWPAHVGDPVTCREGDDFRKRIINPALLHVVRAARANTLLGKAPHGMLPVPTEHGNENPRTGPTDKTLTTLDLGCGEGYLGRMLERQGHISKYVGVDRSKVLLECLKKRAATEKCRAQYASAPRSLDAPKVLGDDELDADMVFLVLVLEHLAAPDQLLMEMADRLKPTTICVAVTLNPHYIDDQEEGPPSSATALREASSRRSARLPWKTGASWATYEVRVHSHEVYETWFRDAGYVIHRSQALMDPDRPWMPPPFTLWVFSTMGTKVDAGGTSQVSNTPLSSLTSPPVAKQRIRVDPDHPILTRHMRGGQLFIVEEGTADAYISGTPTTFEPGTMFGDIEAGWGAGRDEVYHFPVWAGSDGCVLTVVPASCVNTLVPEKSFDAMRFEQLRSRLIRRWWLYPADPVQGTKTTTTGAPPAGDMIRLARALCLALATSPLESVLHIPTLAHARASGSWDGYRDLYALVKYGFVLSSEKPDARGSSTKFGNNHVVVLDPLGLRALALAHSFHEAEQLIKARECPLMRSVVKVTCEDVYAKRTHPLGHKESGRPRYEERSFFERATASPRRVHLILPKRP